MNIVEIMWQVLGLFAIVFAVLLSADLCIWVVKSTRMMWNRFNCLYPKTVDTINIKLESEK